MPTRGAATEIGRAPCGRHPRHSASSSRVQLILICSVDRAMAAAAFARWRAWPMERLADGAQTVHRSYAAVQHQRLTRRRSERLTFRNDDGLPVWDDPAWRLAPIPAPVPRPAPGPSPGPAADRTGAGAPSRTKTPRSDTSRQGEDAVPRIAAIWRYPVKGLAGERLDSVALTAVDVLPHDRRFALAQGSTRFDPAAPAYLKPDHFHQLKREEKLAQLGVAFDPDTGVLTLSRKGKPVVRGDATDPTGRLVLTQFFATFLGAGARGVPKLLAAPGHSFTDSPDRTVSVLNLASVQDLERVVRAPVDPRRFRANLWLEGLEPWQEAEWVGRSIALGPPGRQLRLKVVEPIVRCAATNVDPETAERDLNIPLGLQRGYGHCTMGVYCEVLDDGEIAVGEAADVPAERAEALPF